MSASKRHEPLWMRYRRAALAVALLVVVAGIVLLVVLLGSWLRPSGQLLTITKPEGGTISAAGITCGTRRIGLLDQPPEGRRRSS